MITHGELVCDSDAKYFEQRHSLNARQTRRWVGSSLTTATEGHDDFFRLVALSMRLLVLAQCCVCVKYLETSVSWLLLFSASLVIPYLIRITLNSVLRFTMVKIIAI